MLWQQIHQKVQELGVKGKQITAFLFIPEVEIKPEPVKRIYIQAKFIWFFL